MMAIQRDFLLKYLYQKVIIVTTLCIDSVAVICWLAALTLVLYQFNRPDSSHHTHRILKISSISYITFGLCAWILWILKDISTLLAIPQLDQIATIAYIVTRFPATNLSFFVFILFRLKLIFKGTLHEISSCYVGTVILAAVLSCSLNSWWRFLFADRIDGSSISVPPSYETVVMLCKYQYYAVDALVQLSMIYLFNKRLFHLIAEARRHRSYAVSLGKHNKAARKFNQRQLALINAVSKHALLVGIMVTANLVWMIWFTAVPQWIWSQDLIWHLLDNTVYLVVFSVQLTALYLSFDFASEWYRRMCWKRHQCCGKCCEWLIVKHLEQDIEKQYVLMLQEDPPERERA